MSFRGCIYVVLCRRRCLVHWAGCKSWVRMRRITPAVGRVRMKNIEVSIPVGSVVLEGLLRVPAGARCLVIFCHGSGSSRHSKRNQFVANNLSGRGLATLLFDLLTSDEEEVDAVSRHLRFDIPMLAERVRETVLWAASIPEIRSHRIGLFGASTGAAAALVTAANLPHIVNAVVSRGGRPDLADDALSRVRAPTLLIVGGADEEVLELNRLAMARMKHAVTKLEIVPGATHLFEEEGALKKVAVLAGDWLERSASDNAEKRVGDK